MAIKAIKERTQGQNNGCRLMEEGGALSREKEAAMAAWAWWHNDVKPPAAVQVTGGRGWLRLGHVGHASAGGRDGKVG
jgi:hypothetical protein